MIAAMLVTNEGYVMNYPEFKAFTILKHLTERMLTPINQPIGGVEHIKVNNGSVIIDSEFWIGRFPIKSTNCNGDENE